MPLVRCGRRNWNGIREAAAAAGGGNLSKLFTVATLGPVVRILVTIVSRKLGRIVQAICPCTNRERIVVKKFLEKLFDYESLLVNVCENILWWYNVFRLFVLVLC